MSYFARHVSFVSYRDAIGMLVFRLAIFGAAVRFIFFGA